MQTPLFDISGVKSASPMPGVCFLGPVTTEERVSLSIPTNRGWVICSAIASHCMIMEEVTIATALFANILPEEVMDVV
jgi:hypothetical protein